MERLNSVNLRVKPSSINLGNTHMKLLGHVLSERGISIDPEKQEMIMKWPRPVEGSELASALGLGAFLRDHVRHYADITAPLEKAKREKQIEWTAERDRHWLLFKRAFASVPLLSFPDFSKRFVLATDASQTGIGGILYQPDDDDDTITSSNIVAIASKQLDQTQRNYPVYKKELFAVIYCLRKFHSYLWGRKVTVLTDHKPLVHITNQKLMTVALQQWLDVLLDYDLVIKYRPGLLHVIPDALSRMYACTYQNEDVVWGTRSNIQILSDFSSISSPSDSLCQQSLDEIKPLASIKKRHRVPATSVSGGGKGGKEEKHVSFSQPLITGSHSALSHGYQAQLDEAIAVVSELTCDECEAVSGPLYAASEPLCARLAAATLRSLSPPTDVWVWPEKDESRWQGHSDEEDPSLYVLASSDLPTCASTLTDEEKLLLAQEKRGKRVPSSQAERVSLVEEAHAQGHFGEKAMQHYIDRRGYWWPAMRQDLADVVKMCPACRKYTIVKSGYHPARSVEAFLPGDHIQIDLASFPTSTEGHHFCLVCVDVFTGFLILRPLKQKTAESVARTLWEIFTIIGVPRVLQSDNGTEFKNEILAALTRLEGIEHRFISPYNPRADGKVERSVKTVKETVNKLMLGATCYWHLHLPFVQYAYNNKVQSLTGSTPFSLMFGRLANSPINYEFDEAGLLRDVDAWKKHQEEVLSLVFPAVSTRRSQEQSKSRARVDKLRRNITDESLPAGTVVMLRDPAYALDPSKRPSTAPPYVGPYVVVRRTAHGPYVLNDDRGIKVERLVPLDQMKVLYSPDDAPDGAEEESVHTSYEVEKILDHTKRNDDGEDLFQVKWKGYPISESSWLPRARFNDLAIVDEYLKSINGLRRSDRKRKLTSASAQPANRQFVPSTSSLMAHVHPSRLGNFLENR
jgi:transposase InsO family protein